MAMTDIFLPPVFDALLDSAPAATPPASYAATTRESTARPAQLQRLLSRFADVACLRNEHQLAVPHA